MAATTISTLTVCRPKCNATRLPSPSCSSLPLQLARLRTQTPARFTSYCCSNNLSATSVTQRRYSTSRRIRAVAEEAEQSVAPEGNGSAEGEPGATTTVDQTVSVQVSPSDILTMFFRAEGTMNETAIPAVTKALEGTEGITDLKVQVLEGIASVELTKQTTVQATGVASGLLEAIQGSGFKLQTLNLSFQDDEDLS